MIIIDNLLIFLGGMIAFFTWHNRHNKNFTRQLGWTSFAIIIPLSFVKPFFEMSPYEYYLLIATTLAGAIITSYITRKFIPTWVIAIISSTYAIAVATRLVTLPYMFMQVFAATLLVSLAVLILLLIKHPRKYGWILCIGAQIAIIGIDSLHPFSYVGIAIFILYFAEWLLAEYPRYLLEHEARKNELQSLKEDYQFSVANETLRRTALLEKSIENIKEKSMYDPLTKAYNRDGLQSIYKELIEKSSKQPFSILLFDIDNFKGINDRLGHNVGDECLKRLAYLIRISKRDEDYLIRLGGDEFMVILPHLPSGDALKVGRRFIDAIRKNTNPAFTVSMGVSTYPANASTLEDLIEVADKGLYLAKERGKNQVAYSTE